MLLPVAVPLQRPAMTGNRPPGLGTPLSPMLESLKLVFGEMAEVIVASQRVLPEAVKRAGFRFQHPDLNETLAGIV